MTRLFIGEIKRRIEEIENTPSEKRHMMTLQLLYDFINSLVKGTGDFAVRCRAKAIIEHLDSPHLEKDSQ